LLSQISSILLILCLFLASLPTPSNAQETTAAQAKRVMFAEVTALRVEHRCKN